MKLIALDLDGTTLNSKKEMTDITVKAIKKAQQQGHIVMALSGRSYKSIKATLHTYGLSCPIGSSNGTILHADGQLIASTSLSQIQSQRIADILEEEQVPYNMTTNKGAYAPSYWDERLEVILKSGRIPAEHFQNKFFTMFTTSPYVYGHTIFEDVHDVVSNDEFVIQKFLISILDPDIMNRLHQRLSTIEDTYVTSSSPFNLEVTHIDGNKGNGLKLMAKHYHIPMEDTVAMGDERNDIPMLKVAGLSIAMENAEKEVKQYSDVVTLSNDENGVAHAFETYIFTHSE